MPHVVRCVHLITSSAAVLHRGINMLACLLRNPNNLAALKESEAYDNTTTFKLLLLGTRS